MFKVGDRIRIIEQPFDLDESYIAVGAEGVIARKYIDDDDYDWLVEMDNGDRWSLQERAMENLSRLAVNDVAKILGL